MDPKEHETEMAISALISYHVAHILIHTNLSAILRVAGAADVPTSKPTKEELHPNPVGQETHSHAMKAIRLCVDKLDGPSPKPLQRMYTAFLAVLVLRAHVVGIHEEQVGQNYRGYDTQPVKDIVQRERFRPFINLHELDTMKADIHKFSQIVRNKLAGSSWEIGSTSFMPYVIIATYIIAGQEARQILDLCSEGMTSHELSI
jgi:hypothetical protein